jgi:hypothetical protein
LKTMMLMTAMILLLSKTATATDVVNQDNKPYKLKVQGEGKLSISKYDIRPKATMYGLCSASFCSFEIPGSKIEAKKDERVTIRGGKLTK